MQIKNSGLFFLLVASVYLTVAYFSVGYHNYDEHYQILEFANYKLGLTTVDNLAWEFKAQIRPCIQPTIAFLVFKLLLYFDIRDHFFWAFSLRVLSAFLSLFIIKKFVNAVSAEIEGKTLPFFVIASYLLWFLPYINVRYSSESWSGMCFLLSIGLIKSKKFKRSGLQYICIGLAMGLSILFRYQAIILVTGGVFWLYFINHSSVKNLFVLSLIILAVIILGFLLDSWFYGEWVFSIWNYFKSNILQGVASNYGVSPWYEYILYILRAPTIIIGIILLLSLLIFISTYSKNIITWVLVPFLLIHSIIPHKELRFLFQIVNLAPAILVMSYGRLNLSKRNSSLAFQFSIACIVLLNCVALIVSSIKGAGDSRLVIADFIRKKYSGHSIDLICAPYANPYDIIPPRDIFYKNYDVRVHSSGIMDEYALLNYKKSADITLLAIYTSTKNQSIVRNLVKQGRLIEVKKSMPGFCALYVNFYDKGLYSKIITLYEVK